jgi:hypothetical protein
MSALFAVFRHTCEILVAMTIFALAGFAAYFALARQPSSAPAPQHNVQSLVLERLRTVSELHTGVASIQTVVSSSNARQMLGMEIGSAKLLYIAVGQVRAGVDLSNLDETCVRKSEDGTVILLPSPRILDAKIDVEKSHVYDLRQSLAFAPDGIQLHEAAQKLALTQIVEAAVDCGILDVAAQQAKWIVESLVKLSGLEGVRVEVQPQAV